MIVFNDIKKRLSAEGGLTLIEILVSMMVFLVVSAGVAGTLTTGLRTTVHTRLATMGKAVAQEQIEEMRSRVFFVPNSSDPDIGTTADIDLLDLYYPSLNTTDSQGWHGWYTSSENDAYYTMEAPADERGIAKTAVTRFVDNTGTVIIPQSDYDSNSPGYDTPPSNLVAVTVTTSWTDRTGENSYVLDSLISSTGQTVQGAGDSEGETGCQANSNSYADVYGAVFSISTGTVDPYTAFVTGNLGGAHASLSSGCEVSVTGRGIGGIASLYDEPTLTFIPFATGADVSVTGPPEQVENVGPITVGPTAGWPAATITSSKVEGEADISEVEGGKIEGEGEASVGGMSISVQQVDGWPGGTVSDYKRWDFLNPVVQVTGGTYAGEDDPDHADDQAVAEIEQENGQTEGEGKVFYQQINILPLQAKTSSTPSALQGLIFIRNFRADVVSVVDPQSGNASNNVTYSATIGMFDQSKSATCSGDGCYDLYTTVGPTNPIQTAINLSSSNYRLQNALLTEWHSYTTTEINNASIASDDGTTASVSIDALMKITAKFGTEVRWKTANPDKNQITLIDQQGLEQMWLGKFDLSLYQEG